MRSPIHNVGGWLARRAKLSGDRVALLDEGRSFTYRELEERCARLAGWLRRAGLEPGARLALLLGTRSAFLEAVFAAARLGAIAMPINLRLAPPEIAEQLDDAEASILLHEAGLEPKLERAFAAMRSGPRPRTLAVGGEPDAYEEALARSAPERTVVAVAPDDPMLLMYTSGTTGKPKGALLPHRKTLYNSLNAQLFFDLDSRDRVLVPLPLFHSFGLLILSVPALYVGAQLVLQRRFDPEAVWETIGRERIHFFGAVPTMFQTLFETLDRSPAGRFDPSSLRFAFTAGAPIRVELIRAYHERGIVLKQGFGQTETSILCCLDERDALRKAGSVGRPVFHAEVRVVTRESVEARPAEWKDVAPGETGEIVVRGPITMTGYWRRPEETARTLREGWLRTGDLATIDEEGFVTLAGRAQEMFISGGENVYPAQVEAVYQEHPAIREIAIVGVPDPRWGEVGRAYVVLEAGARLDAEELRRWGRERLAAFKLPRSFVAVKELPKTVTGKVQKHRLRELDPPS